MLGLCCHLDPPGSAVCCLLVMEQAENMMGQVVPVRGQQSGRSWGRQQDKVWPRVRGLRFHVSRFLVCFVLVCVVSV